MMTRKAIDAILKSYQDIGKTNAISAQHLPARPDIEQILFLIKNILFPGYFSKDPITEENLPQITAQNCELLLQILDKSIYKSLIWNKTELQNSGDEFTLKKESECISHSFLDYIPELREKLNKDITTAFNGDPACHSHSEVVLAYPGFQAIMSYRIASFFLHKGVPLIPRLMTEIAHKNTGIDIHPGAKIGEHFFIDHGTGVVIGETVEIGNFVTLYHGVTLGSLSVAKDMAQKKRHPTVGDHVTIYANTSILGGLTEIGKHSIIGGNLWIVESVPEYSTMFRLIGDEQIIKPRKTKAALLL